MREILFRGKFGEEWKYGYLSVEPKGFVIKEPYETMRWEKSIQKGQFGNVTIRKSGAYEIRTGAMSLVYKNGERIYTANKLKDAIAFVELHNKRGEKND